MIAYKGTSNLKCRDKEYEVNETYEIDGKLIICRKGFHFCKKLIHVHEFYSFEKKDTVIIEIEILGNVITEDTKSVTNKMKVLRIVPKTEYHKISPKNFDENGNLIYWKDSDGFWEKFKYDKNGNLIYFKNSDGFCEKYEYDENNNLIYLENSDGYWAKWEYDEKGNLIHYENSDNIKFVES